MKITKENYIDGQYDVFKKFHSQLAVLSAGNIDDFNCMTIGWGAMGNIWGHPASAITVYVIPQRHTFQYLNKEEYFTISFFSEEYKEDLLYLGTHSGKDEDKISKTKLTPIALENGVGFKEAQLTFVCKKIYCDQFDINKVPDFMREKVYKTFEPHYEFIGYIEDAFGEI